MRRVWDPAAFFIREAGKEMPFRRPKRQFGEKPEIVARILVIHKYGRGILKRVYKPETIRMQRLAQSLKYNTSKERSKVDKQQGFFIYLSLG